MSQPSELECAFRLLTPVMAAITANGGGNTFRLPHSGIRKRMREDGWDMTSRPMAGAAGTLH